MLGGVLGQFTVVEWLVIGGRSPNGAPLSPAKVALDALVGALCVAIVDSIGEARLVGAPVGK